MKVLDAKPSLKHSTTAEVQFQRALKKVAVTVGNIVEANTNGAEIIDEVRLMRQLREYSEALGPWARKQSAKLLEQVSRHNKKAFFNKSKIMAEEIKKLDQSAIGDVAFMMMNEQVELIKSIPLEAGVRAQRIAAKNILQGARFKPDQNLVDKFFKERITSNQVTGLVEEMERSKEVAINRAVRIARTETARANAAFTEARATSVGAIGYIWRTSMDGAERKSHAEMNNKFIPYGNPPTLSDGTTGDAGMLINCRCYQSPIFSEDEIKKYGGKK